MNQNGFSLDYQTKICNLLVTDPQFLAVNHTLISPTYFDNYHLKNIVRKIYEYYGQYSKAPTKSSLRSMINDYVTKERLDPEIAYTYDAKIDSVYSVDLEDKEFLKDSVILYCKKKEYVSFIDWCYKELSNYTRNLSNKTAKEADEELLKNIDSRFLELMSKGFNKDLGISFRETMTRIPDMVRAESSVVRTKTGFPTLNKVMGGGYRNSGLYVWVAPPGVGKTTILVSEGCDALRQGKSVVYYTFEMSEVEIMLRFAANLFNLTEEDMRDSKKLSFAMEEFSRRYEANLSIKYYHEYEANVNVLISNAKQLELIHDKKVNFILVDYADYLAPVKGLKDSMYQDKGNSYKDLKKMAAVLDIPVISASQTKNEAFRTELIGMQHLEGSSMKAHIVDGLFTLNIQTRDDVLDLNLPPRVLIHIAKLRKRVGFGIQSIMTRFNYSISKCYEQGSE